MSFMFWGGCREFNGTLDSQVTNMYKQDNTSQRNSTIYNNTIGRNDPFFLRNNKIFTPFCYKNKGVKKVQ